MEKGKPKIERRGSDSFQKKRGSASSSKKSEEVVGNKQIKLY